MTFKQSGFRYFLPNDSDRRLITEPRLHYVKVRIFVPRDTNSANRMYVTVASDQDFYIEARK